MNINNTPTLIPWLQDYNRNLSPMVPNCPDGNRYQEVTRQPRATQRYGWPGAAQPERTRRTLVLLRKARQAAAKLLTPANIGKLLVMAVFGGGLGYLFITQLLG